MEELTSSVFSTREAGDVEGNIRGKLLESLRVKSVKERERFARHLLSEPQKPNFQLLIVAFCRKFSTLVSECSLLADKPNRKADFSVAWMKMLGNFEAGKGTQERSIIEQFLVGQSEGQHFSPEVVHAVISVIHELVYCTIHCHIQLKKSTSTSEPRNSCLAVESDDTMFRYCGAALHRMIKLRKETLQQKKKKRVVGECRPNDDRWWRRKWMCCVPWSWKTNLPFPQALKGQYHAIFSNTLKIEKTLFDKPPRYNDKIPLKDCQSAKKLSTDIFPRQMTKIKRGSNLKTSGGRFQISLS